MMTRLDDQFLDRLADDLAPVRPVRDGALFVGLVIGCALGILLVSLTLGLRADLLGGHPHPMFLFRTATLALLGAVCAVAAASAARPGVGRNSRTAMLALAIAGVVPMTALGVVLVDTGAAVSQLWQPSARWCLSVSLGGALCFAGMFTWHLRRGAPVAPERAGLVAGAASACLGLLVYSMHCPVNHLSYIGVWYSLVVAIGAVAGRYGLSRLIRW